METLCWGKQTSSMSQTGVGKFERASTIYEKNDPRLTADLSQTKAVEMIPDWLPSYRRHLGHSPRHHRLKKIIGCSCIFTNLHQNHQFISEETCGRSVDLYCNPSCSFQSFYLCVSILSITIPPAHPRGFAPKIFPHPGAFAS